MRPRVPRGVRVVIVVRRQDDSPRGTRQHGSMSPRRFLALAVTVAFAAALVPFHPAAASTTASLGQRYDIAATLDVATGRLDATMTLEVTNEAPFSIDHVDLGVVPRALGFFTLKEPVTVDGEPVEATWTTSINLEVPLGELRPDATAAIGMAFRLDVAGRRTRSPQGSAATTAS